MKPFSVVTVLVVSLTVCSFPLLSQPAHPKQEKLVFENQYVRVYEVTLNPGTKLQPHESGDRIVYSQNSYSLSYQWEGKTAVEKRKAGDVHFHPHGIHAEVNDGKGPARYLLVERLSAPLPAAGESGADMAKANPHNTKVIFDRDMAKVFEVTLYPDDAVSTHFGLHRLICCTQTCNLMVSTPDGKSSRETMKKGTYHWHEAGLHAVKNVGATGTKLLVFGFKK